MKFPRPFALLAAGLTATASAQTPAASPSPSATPEKSVADPMAARLFQQDGGKDAVTLPLGEVLHVMTGGNILPFDSANSSDKAFLARLSEAMDRVLPLINRSDSNAQNAARLFDTSQVAIQIEESIARLFSHASYSISRRYYPTLRLEEPSSGKSYCLAVELYPPGDRREMARRRVFERTFRIDAAEAKFMIGEGSNHCCLFVGIEYEMKSNGFAFLNWDIVDVSNLPIRAAVTFDASSVDIYHPGAILTDGRKGSD